MSAASGAKEASGKRSRVTSVQGRPRSVAFLTAASSSSSCAVVKSRSQRPDFRDFASNPDLGSGDRGEVLHRGRSLISCNDIASHKFEKYY